VSDGKTAGDLIVESFELAAERCEDLTNDLQTYVDDAIKAIRPQSAEDAVGSGPSLRAALIHTLAIPSRSESVRVLKGGVAASQLDTSTLGEWKRRGRSQALAGAGGFEPPHGGIKIRLNI
jgi:hypothetical protein